MFVLLLLRLVVVLRTSLIFLKYLHLRRILEARLLCSHVHHALLLLTGRLRHRQPRIIGLAGISIHRVLISHAAGIDALIGKLLFDAPTLQPELGIQSAVECFLDAGAIGRKIIGRAISFGHISDISLQAEHVMRNARVGKIGLLFSSGVIVFLRVGSE